MYTDKNGDTWYKVGLHMHTTESDGRVPIEAAAKIYKAAGFDVIAITDHWKYHGEDEICGLKIISGSEYNLGASDTSVDVMHIVGVGMDKDPFLVRGKCTRQEVIDAIVAVHGMAILAHPAWSLNTPDEAKALSGIGAVEIYNTVSNVGQSRRPDSSYFIDLLANEGFTYPIIATDDAHYYNGEDATVSYIEVRSKSNSKDDILKAIESRDFYASQGPRVYVRCEGDKIIADTSECAIISFLSNLAWAPDRVVKGDALTHAEYTVKENDKWVRVEVVDINGKYAWSNIVEL